MVLSHIFNEGNDSNVSELGSLHSKGHKTPPALSPIRPQNVDPLYGDADNPHQTSLTVKPPGRLSLFVVFAISVCVLATGFMRWIHQRRARQKSASAIDLDCADDIGQVTRPMVGINDATQLQDSNEVAQCQVVHSESGSELNVFDSESSEVVFMTTPIAVQPVMCSYASSQNVTSSRSSANAYISDRDCEQRTRSNESVTRLGHDPYRRRNLAKNRIQRHYANHHRRILHGEGSAEPEVQRAQASGVCDDGLATLRGDALPLRTCRQSSLEAHATSLTRTLESLVRDTRQIITSDDSSDRLESELPPVYTRYDIPQIRFQNEQIHHRQQQIHQQSSHRERRYNQNVELSSDELMNPQHRHLLIEQFSDGSQIVLLHPPSLPPYDNDSPPPYID